MKRILYILECICMLTVMLNVPVHAEYSDIDDSKFKNDIIELKRIGVIKGYPDGLFRPYENISKAEFVSLIATITGMKTNDDTQSLYIDIPQEHWAIGAVNHCSDLGYLRAIELKNKIKFVTLDEEGNEIEVSELEYIPEIAAGLRKSASKENINKVFNPNENISVKDALKMIIYVLGYSDYAEFTGIEKTCNDLGITEYIDFDENRFLSREEAANIINIAIHLPIVEKTNVINEDEEHTEYVIMDGKNSEQRISLYDKYFDS